MLMRAAWAACGDLVDADASRFRSIGRAAIGALHDELALDPKPGLVSPVDDGSHDDMTAATFFRSLIALRRYFVDIAAAGARHAPFVELEALGIAAEQRMLIATGGVNTHRGAIFSIGLLCAAVGASASEPTADKVRASLEHHWGAALRERATRSCDTRPSRVGLRSAGLEAALGMPTLFDHAWPAWRQASQDGLDERRCRLQVLFTSMAVLDDTNLVQRAGIEGLRFGQSSARQFLDAGGAHHPDAFIHARKIRDAFVERRLSPGGSADVLAAACWLHRTVRAG